MNSTYPCHFCSSENSIQMYESVCKTCRVTYHVNQPNPPNSNQWKLFGITYYLHDPILHSLVMHMDTQFTLIWFQAHGAAVNKKLTIPQLFPLPKPDEAAPLAHRLVKLVTFS